MNNLELLDHLRELHIIVGVDGDTLQVKAPPGAITDELRAVIRLRKSELVQALGDEDTVKLLDYACSLGGCNAGEVKPDEIPGRVIEPFYHVIEWNFDDLHGVVPGYFTLDTLTDIVTAEYFSKFELKDHIERIEASRDGEIPF